MHTILGVKQQFARIEGRMMQNTCRGERRASKLLNMRVIGRITAKT